MGFGDILELVLTFGVLLAIWGVPRLALGAREKRRRTAAKEAAVPARARETAGGDAYDWDEETAARWVERQRGAGGEAAEAAAALYEPEPEPESLLVVSWESLPVSVAPPGRHMRSSRRRDLRRAVIWKEILDAPRALRPYDGPAGSA